MKQFDKILSRLKKQGVLHTLKYFLGTALLQRASIYINMVYCHKPSALKETNSNINIDFSIIKSYEEFSKNDKKELMLYGGERLRNVFIGAFDNGKICCISRNTKGLASVCWALKTVNSHSGISVLISNCFTIPEQRGRNYYSETLNYLCGYIYDEYKNIQIITIECSYFNKASDNGIVKSGFVCTHFEISVFNKLFLKLKKFSIPLNIWNHRNRTF